MGAEVYWYVVDYQEDIEAALQGLRRREFEAGRYNPVIPFPAFPIGPSSPSPGAQHNSYEEAMEASAEDGTRSIIDLMSTGPEPDFCTAGPLPDAVLERLFGTTQPTRGMVEGRWDFFDEYDRGHGIYIVLYKDGAPSEILFAGLSFD